MSSLTNPEPFYSMTRRAGDLLFLSGNPLETLDTLRDPLLVMKAGEIICHGKNISTVVHSDIYAGRR